MNSNIFRTLAGMAWAAALMAGAAPASAVAITSQTGLYASCSGSFQNYGGHFCGTSQMLMPDDGWYTEYKQQIKMITTACSSGACQADASTVYTDMVYPTGRKVVTGTQSCAGGGWVHYLGTCAC
jgi:hypothetical protein